MGPRRVAFCVVVALGLADAARAQTASAPASPAAQASPAVTVTGKAPDYRREVDRKTYTLSSDLQAAHGSIGDALRDIPSVDVDPRGNISLRGDRHVTILVDGQPSALFQGATRAQMLQQLPADQFECVEVMTNPSAAFSAEGTAGIINLITKKNHKTKPTGSIRASTDTLGRDSLSVSGADSVGKLTLSGSAGVNRFVFLNNQQAIEQLSDPTSGQTAQVTSTAHSRAVAWLASGRVNADYDLDSQTRLSAGLGYYAFGSQASYGEAYASSALNGPLANDYDSTGAEHGTGHVFTATAGFSRQLGGDDHELSANLSYSAVGASTDNEQLFAFSLPAQTDLFQNLISDTGHEVTDLKVEYHGPLPGPAKLVVGYEFNLDQDGLDRQEFEGESASDAVVDPLQSDRFSATQAVNDFYATYDRSFGRFELLPGVRIEAATLDTDQLDTRVADRSTYYEVYPTLHATYKLTNKIVLAASYSRRVSRPPVSELDPFRVETSPLSFSSGNADLKPAITDSYEADLEYNGRKLTYEADAFYKDTGNVISPFTENLGGSVLLSTFQNFGHLRQAGGELSASLKVSNRLSLSLSGDASWDAYASPVTPLEHLHPEPDPERARFALSPRARLPDRLHLRAGRSRGGGEARLRLQRRRQPSRRRRQCRAPLACRISEGVIRGRAAELRCLGVPEPPAGTGRQRSGSGWMKP
jgi:outer membrane receptor protein involved in Fe transport